MAEKKSFFDRLTGSVRIDNGTDEFSSEPATQPKTITKNFQEKDYVEELKKPAAAQKEVTFHPVAESKPAPQEKEPAEQLPASLEGQLTIDVYQTNDEIVIKSTIAGVSPEDVDITVTKEMVTIKGKRVKDETIRDEDYFYQECYWGAFSRSVILPFDVDSNKAVATIKNGILTLRLPRLKTQKIKVKSV